MKSCRILQKYEQPPLIRLRISGAYPHLHARFASLRLLDICTVVPISVVSREWLKAVSRRKRITPREDVLYVKDWWLRVSRCGVRDQLTCCSAVIAEMGVFEWSDSALLTKHGPPVGPSTVLAFVLGKLEL